MTIVTSVKVRDGLTLATDSMTQIHQDGRYITSYQNARKLFRIRDLPVGAMSYGLGNIGDHSVEGVVRDFCTGLAANVKNVQPIAERLYTHVMTLYDAQFAGVPDDELPALGFYIAGYGGGGPFAEQWEFLIPRDTGPFQVTPNQVFGANWRGIDIVFTRLYKGLDPRLIPALQAKGFTDAEIDQLFASVEASVAYDGMPVQDAVNFAAYIVKTTIGMATYESGVPSCGGPLQVATILPDGEFTWIERPSLAVQI